MTESIPVPPRSKRALAAKIAGIVGVVICAAIIVVIWLGRGAISGAIDGLAANVNGGFDRAIAATDAVADRLDEAASNVASVAADATELASTSSPSPERLSGIQARLGELADRYRELRTRYGEVKENLSSVGATLQAIRRFVPGARVPEAPTEVLAGIDERVRAVDEALTSVWAGLQEAAPGSAAAQALADRMTALQGVVSDAADVAAGVSSNLESAQADTANAIGGIQTLLLIAALVISALLLWVLLLNVALWLLGRAWQREAVTPVPSAPADRPPSDAPAPEAPTA
jgi:hypothetical protein